MDYPKGEPFYSERCLSYFREARRADFKLGNGERLEINFVLAESECISADDTKAGTHGMFSNPTHMGGLEPRARYETLYYPKEEFGDDLDVLIQFGQRSNVKGIITYGAVTGYRLFSENSLPLVLGHRSPGVIITHNNMTFYAREAKFDPKTRILETTKGTVIVEDGSKRYQAKKISITIRNEEVRIRSS